MFNLFRKIPKGYVETVDGYLIKESQAKKVIYSDEYSEEYKVFYYRKEKAPVYDKMKSSMGLFGMKDTFYKNEVEVSVDGTPIGYHTPEEVQQLKDRIKELEDKLRIASGDYKPNDIINCLSDSFSVCPVPLKNGYIGEIAGEELYTFKPKNKRGRPKKNA